MTTTSFVDPFGYFPTGDPMINVATAMRDTNDKVIGIIGGSFDAISLEKIITSQHQKDDDELGYWIYSSKNLIWNEAALNNTHGIYEMTE